MPVAAGDTLEDDTVIALICYFDSVSHIMFKIKHVTIVKGQILYGDQVGKLFKE